MIDFNRSYMTMVNTDGSVYDWTFLSIENIGSVSNGTLAYNGDFTGLTAITSSIGYFSPYRPVGAPSQYGSGVAFVDDLIQIQSDIDSSPGNGTFPLKVYLTFKYVTP